MKTDLAILDKARLVRSLSGELGIELVYNFSNSDDLSKKLHLNLWVSGSYAEITKRSLFSVYGISPVDILVYPTDDYGLIDIPADHVLKTKEIYVKYNDKNRVKYINDPATYGFKYKSSVKEWSDEDVSNARAELPEPSFRPPLADRILFWILCLIIGAYGFISVMDILHERGVWTW